MKRLSQIEREVLIGTVIGDGCVFRGVGNTNYRMNLAHSLKQKEYFLKKYGILKEIVRSEPKERTWLDSRTNKEYSEIRFQSKTDPLFTEMHKIWYRDKKIINYAELMKCRETTLAVKFFDDGYFKQSHTIAMNDYDLQSVDAFRAWLKDQFNFDTTMQKRKVVYIRTKHQLEFIETIKPFATNDVLYKLGSPV